jgi:hypothetical protein
MRPDILIKGAESNNCIVTVVIYINPTATEASSIPEQTAVVNTCVIIITVQSYTTAIL